MDNVGEFLIDMSRLFLSETVDGINELADVLSPHQGVRVVGTLQQW